jgi:hypothetical protein
VHEGVGWQPIPRQDSTNAPLQASMETGRGPFGIPSLASLGIQLANIGGPPPLPGQDGRCSSIATQHSADAVIQSVPDPKWVVADRNKIGPSLPGAKGKRSKTSKSVGSLASTDAIEACLYLVDADMPAERLLPSTYERTKKARVERGQ